MMLKKLIICLPLFCIAGCAFTTSRTLSIEKSDSEAVITIQAKDRSYFDPDGFSREYQPKARITLFGKGKRMSYRNVPGTTYRFGADFKVDIDYCTAGYLWLSEDRGSLSVRLYDVKPPEGLTLLKSLSGTFKISEGEAAKLPQ